MNGATVPPCPLVLREADASGGGTGGSSGGGSVAPFRELFQAGLDASWELDIFGGIRRNIEAAGADLQAVVEDRRDVLIILVGDVGSNYINLRGFQQQIDIAHKTWRRKSTMPISSKSGMTPALWAGWMWPTPGPR